MIVRESHPSSTAPGSCARQLSACPRELVRFDLSIVKLADRSEDACQLGHRGAAPRLRRMGGQHQADVGVCEQLPQVIGARPASGDDRHRLAQRPAAWRGRLLALARADAANPLVVLGEVDEAEVARECAHEHRCLLDRQARHQGGQLVRGDLLTRSSRLAQGAGALLERERVRALLRLDHLAEQSAEQIDVVMQCARHIPSSVRWARDSYGHGRCTQVGR